MNIKKIIVMKLMLVSLFLVSLTVQTSAQSGRQIKFAKGKYSTTVAGRVAKDSTTKYSIELNKNQRFRVKFTTKKQYVYITVKDNNGNTLREDNNGTVLLTTPYAGFYTIEISTKYGQADNFTFIVEAR